MHLQISEFIFPWAWPDMLGAYSPWMRTAAVVHVILAACYGFVFWDPSWFPWLAQKIDDYSHSPFMPDFKYFAITMLTSFVCGLFVLPFLYLWVIRYCSVCFLDKEIDALLKDISSLAEAACSLGQLLRRSLRAENAVLEAYIASHNLSGWNSSNDAAQSLRSATIPGASNKALSHQSRAQDSSPASTRNILEVCSRKSEESQSSKAELIEPSENLAGKPAGNDAAEQSQDGSPSTTEVLPVPDHVCKHQSSSTGSFMSAPSKQSKQGVTKNENFASQSTTPVDNNRHTLQL